MTNGKRRQHPAVIKRNQDEYESNHERRLAAYNMRLAGLPYHEIGRRFGISESRARQVVRDFMKNTEEEKQEEVRQFERDRLDKLQTVVEADLTSSIPKVRLSAIDRALRISESRRKLYGLDALERSQIEKEKTQAEIDLDELIKKARERAYAEQQEMRNAANTTTSDAE